jgi:hypothetical protein
VELVAAAYSDTLVYINISSCDKLTDVALRHLQSCVKLQKLCIKKLDVSDEAFQDLVQYLKDLEHLDIGCCAYKIPFFCLSL